ncbi:hypothetical protein BU24DRAFT_474932 [Aaosphaeria arxii CBS 175.79]|uniref:Transcription factor domain-containing protein n=1 Tax=Aaosphaeria arxii CBS 175.79 TaxID=1450172 RepID=A0A6A5X7H3_9PLEO|nr:uncharacterized protein BU24DRAFT_474932 [Aaosphaeria arxii CBS 175.79]KAF2008869.1 hypothetical protein BU24DRAFT_474932 [Aaosphaeria arxii CBS 175.79]
MNDAIPREFCSPSRPTLLHSALLKATVEKAFLCLPDELISVVCRRYIEQVHPQLPVIDIKDLLQALEPQQARGNRISVLLWQALTSAVIPFLTDDELGRAGLVCAHTALDTFVHRTKVLLDIDYDECPTTQLQVILLLYWRLSQEKSNRSLYRSVHRWALEHTKQIEPGLIASHYSRPSSQTSLHIRLWWSCYILQIGFGLEALQSTTGLEHPAGIRPPQMNDFEISWFSSPRAQDWYASTGLHQALHRYLQSASFFCRKAETCMQITHLFNTAAPVGTVTSHKDLGQSFSGGDFPVSKLFWMAMNIDAKLQELTREGICGITPIVEERDQGLSLNFHVHTAEFIILHQCLILLLLWSEKHSMAPKSHQYQTPGIEVAKDLIQHTIEQTVIALSRMLETLCFYRLPLLTHNTNARILENVRSAKNTLATANGADRDDHNFGQLADQLGSSLWRYENYIALQPTSIIHVSSSDTDDGVEPGQVRLSEDHSTTTSTPADSGPSTPPNSLVLHREGFGKKGLQAQWESFGCELLQAVDYVRMY